MEDSLSSLTEKACNIFLTKIPFMNEVIKLCIIISVKVQVFEEKK